MSRISIPIVEPSPPPKPAWSATRWAVWITLAVAIGLWAGMLISA